jgi:hypothetical protein
LGDQFWEGNSSFVIPVSLRYKKYAEKAETTTEEQKVDF